MLERLGRHVAQAVGQFERLGMPHLESRCVIQFRRLLLDRLHDPGPVVARVAAPEPRRPVQHLAPIGGLVVHPVGTHEHSGVLLELPVGRERHPEGTQVVRNRVATVGFAVQGHIGAPHFGPGLSSPGACIFFLTKRSRPR
jgi:hypothetical protein